MNINLPKPKPEPEYDKIIKEGFDKYPKRYENYLRYKKSKYEDNIDYLPIKIDIENVSRCNLSCSMCLVSLNNIQKRAEDLSFSDFKKILDEQIGVFEIKVQGVGEPFLQKDFVDMVTYAANKSIWTRSTTNATLLHKHDNYKRIIDANIGELQISIDGTTKESFEKIRKGASFDLVKENCKLINNYCKDVGVEKTRMWSLIQNDNFKNIKDFPILAKELGFNRLTLSLDVNGWGNETFTKMNMKKNVANILNEDIVNQVLEISSKIGIETTFWDISEKYSKDNLCPWPFERSFISSDKKVVPCCMISNPDTFSFGKIDKFENIWSSLEYIKFRKGHLSGNIPDVCKFCYEKNND